MRFLLRVTICILTNAVAIFVAVKLVDGINLQLTFSNLLKAGLVLGLINASIKPIVKLFSLPFIILTFGLFTLVINTVLLLFASYLLPSFSIDGFWPALLGVIVISAVNYLISLFVKD
ncbi:MAG: phage holin family protein [Candidatus Moranbacteria bacterium]|nr:phage holin family protein [Candidatus Moranbacteria bacterium]